LVYFSLFCYVAPRKIWQPCVSIELPASAEFVQQGCQMAYFQTKNANLGKFWSVNAMEDVGKFYGHFVYFIAIWYILRPFGIFCGHFGIYFPFWYAVPRKIWQP
jgi:hypothetical protein